MNNILRTVSNLLTLLAPQHKNQQVASRGGTMKMAVIIALKDVSERKQKLVSKEPAEAFQLLFFTGVRYERQSAPIAIKPTHKRVAKLSLKKA
jgi:hypothetical protein